MGSRRRIVRLAASGLLASAAAVAACVGDDPAAPSPPTDDAGASDATSGTDAGGGGTDASENGDTGGGGDAAAEAGFDGGPPAWNATLPAGTTSVLASAGNLLCRFEMLDVQTATAPPKWEVYLRKVDAPAATCNEPKGIRALGSAYSTPAAALLRQQNADRYVYAFSAKQSLSGSAPEVLTIEQFDGWSGNDMHAAILKTKAVVGQPMFPSLHLTTLFFGDPSEEAVGTIRVKGTGSFPGETGTGTYFYALYTGFIGATGQPASAADACTRAE